MEEKEIVHWFTENLGERFNVRVMVSIHLQILSRTTTLKDIKETIVI